MFGEVCRLRVSADRTVPIHSPASSAVRGNVPCPCSGARMIHQHWARSRRTPVRQGTRTRPGALWGCKELTLVVPTLGAVSSFPLKSSSVVRCIPLPRLSTTEALRFSIAYTRLSSTVVRLLALLLGIEARSVYAGVLPQHCILIRLVGVNCIHPWALYLRIQHAVRCPSAGRYGERVDAGAPGAAINRPQPVLEHMARQRSGGAVGGLAHILDGFPCTDASFLVSRR